MSVIKFLKQFFKQPTVIGAIAPSSKGLAKYMVKQINFNTVDTIVEYGPGTGVFTSYILAQKRPETTFFALELNEELYTLACKNVPEAIIFQDSAAQINSYLKNFNKKHADAIISGLPWAAFSDKLQNEILTETLKALPEGGTFSTFAYLQGLILPSGISFRKKLNKYFSSVKTSPIVWKNLPPAIVYWCKK